jgi:hypothetical protein
VLTAAEVARRRLGGRLGLRRPYEPAVALLGAAAALTVGGVSLTIYMLQGGALPRVNPALAFGPRIAIQLFNVPLALGIAWLEFGRFLALRDRSAAGCERRGLRRVLGLIFAGLLLTMGLAACGGGGSATGQPAGSTKVTMTDFRFSPQHA